MAVSSQVQYSIKRPVPAKATPTSSRGTRGATAKQRQQEQQPDSSEAVSFVTQLRDYSSEQGELVSALLQAAGQADSKAVLPKQEASGCADLVHEDGINSAGQEGAAVRDADIPDGGSGQGTSGQGTSGDLPNKRVKKE